MFDHGRRGCSPDNVASLTWPTSLLRVSWARTCTTWTARLVRYTLCACCRVALATWAELLELPTSGLPIVSFYDWFLPRRRFRGEVNVGFCRSVTFLDIHFCVKTNSEIQKCLFWQIINGVHMRSDFLTQKGSVEPFKSSLAGGFVSRIFTWRRCYSVCVPKTPTK